jgi:hypothetical protein
MAMRLKLHPVRAKPSKRRQRTPSLDAMRARFPAGFELTDQDRVWESMPPVGAERFWEPAHQRLPLAKRIALRRFLGRMK